MSNPNAHDQIIMAAQRWSAERKEIFDTFQRNHDADVAKIEQLIADAEAKATEFVAKRDYGQSSFYWGFAEGLKRSLSVIKGLG